MKIEVAYFKSSFSDVAGTVEGKGKGNTPKEESTCDLSLGHTVKNRMTVIYGLDGVLSRNGDLFAPALRTPAFVYKTIPAMIQK